MASNIDSYVCKTWRTPFLKYQPQKNKILRYDCMQSSFSLLCRVHHTAGETGLKELQLLQQREASSSEVRSHVRTMLFIWCQCCVRKERLSGSLETPSQCVPHPVMACYSLRINSIFDQLLLKVAITFVYCLVLFYVVWYCLEIQVISLSWVLNVYPCLACLKLKLKTFIK